MKFIYHNEYHGIEFSYFEKNGYELVEIPQNDNTYIDKISDGDVLFIKLDDIDYINEHINNEYKLTIFLFINPEYTITAISKVFESVILLPSINV